MKKIWLFSLLSGLLLLIGVGSFSLAQLSTNISATDPAALLDAFVDKAQEDGEIQNTSLDTVTSWAAGKSGNPNLRITNTVMRIVDHLNPYIQWICYLGFCVATILLIYNGFLMVTNAVHDQGELKKIQKNFVYIGIGVVILVGFYFLLDIVVAVINLLG